MECDTDNYLKYFFFQVENVSASVYGKVGEWSEVAVPVPYMTTFSSSWFYTFTSLQSATVYDVVGMGKGHMPSNILSPCWKSLHRDILLIIFQF